MATTGATLGVIGFILCWIPFLGIGIGWVLGILAIIFGGIGMSRAGQVYVGKNAAVAGLVLGILTIVLKSIPILNIL